MSAISFITSLARKILARESKGITKIPTQMAAEAKAGEIAAILQNAGLPLNRVDEFIKSEQDLVRILNMIESTPPVMREVPSGIRNTESAKVFNIEGKELNPKKPIIGGTQTGKELSKKRSDRLRGTETDRIKQRIADKKVETEAEIAERLGRENKKTVDKIKIRQKFIDQSIDNVSPGFAGDRKYDAELVAEDLATRMGKVYDDLPTKERLDLYGQAYTGLSKQRFKNRPASEDRALEDFVDDAGGVNPDDPRGIDDFIPEPEDMATGGRAGFKGGSYDYNSFEHKINELKAAYKRYKKGSSTSGRGGIMTFEQFAPLFAKENFATGGRAGFKLGTGEKFLKFLKKFKIKQSGDGVNEFLSKRQFMKDIVGNTEKARKARQLEEIKEAMKNAKGYQFPSGKELRTDIEKTIAPILLKDRKLNATGGRIGYADGTPSFEEYMQERQGIEKKQNFERLYKEYLEDLRRKSVMEQKQMAAEGGRIGLKAGMTKRAFLKLMGGVGAGIAGLKSGLLGIGKGAATKQVAKEVVEQGVRSAPPPYFFELANKIKTLGKPDKVTYADRVEIHRYTGKNGDEYELIEDLNTGDMRIQKDKMGGATYGDESFDVIDDRTVLEYRKGEVGVKDEGMDTQKTFKEADEYEEYKVEFDQDGTEAAADNVDEVIQKEILEEAKGDAPSIKKAGGGIARMLGE